MTFYEAIADLEFYLRAAEHGMMLIVMIVLLGIRSLMKDEPLFSL